MSHFSALYIVPAFGIDTFVIAVGLGSGPYSGRWRLAATAAVFEGGMPLLGAVIGAWMAHFLSGVVVYVAAAILAALAVRELREGIHELGEDDDEDQDEGSHETVRLRRATSFIALVGAGLAVSLDELTAGLAAGAAHLNLGVLIPALALQAVLFTLLGLAAGARLRRAVGRYGEVAAGVALLLAAMLVVVLAASGA